jgi:5-methylcytosine-specific restriction endonuclease McrA
MKSSLLVGFFFTRKLNNYKYSKQKNENEIMILVLNADYTPMSVTTLGRGFKLVFKGKAEVVVSDRDNPFIYSPSKAFNRPSVIRLKKYIVFPYRKVPMTRQNIYKRDGFKCGYCSNGKNLTLDHIFPRSRGGQNSWKNLVTCCFDCNSRKGDKTPEEAEMILNVKPFAPSYIHLFSKSDVKEDWKIYVFKD